MAGQCGVPECAEGFMDSQQAHNYSTDHFLEDPETLADLQHLEFWMYICTE